jgi:hypothetical protein
VEDGWRESSRTPRRAPAGLSQELIEPSRTPDLAPQRERPLELDPDPRPRLRAPARLQHHAQDAVDAEPGVPEAVVGQAMSNLAHVAPAGNGGVTRRRNAEGRPSVSCRTPGTSSSRTTGYHLAVRGDRPQGTCAGLSELSRRIRHRRVPGLEGRDARLRRLAKPHVIYRSAVTRVIFVTKR